MKDKINITFLNSLSKTIDNSFDFNDELKEICMLKNEQYSFQIALKSDVRYGWAKLKVSGISKKDIKISTVKYVYGKYLDVSNNEFKADDFYINKGEGLYPDILLPLDKTNVHLAPNSLTTLFITIKLVSGVMPKEKIKFTFYAWEKEKIGEKSLPFKVINKDLAENDLLITHWFHHDCLSTFYHLKVFGKKYYKVFENYLKNYVENGNTMLLIPLFTPCLDTKVGGQRPTTQLIRVEKADDKWLFNFEKLDYFLKFIKERGIKYFEFSHLFTQWGAKYCPKIVYKENGKIKKGFGWKLAGDSKEYINFLDQFLPELDKYLKDNGYEKISYFHISDEPNVESIERYTSHKAQLKKYLSNYTFMDALSDFSFADKVDLPVVSDDHIQKFIDNNVTTMVYYCCCQGNQNVPNAFINMPSIRNRIIGFMMYLNDSAGFLQWGYNFYFAPLSIGKINPYIYTDGVGSYNPGDPFLVYPGLDYEPIDSLRLKIFNEAMQDYRLCKTLENKIGRQEVKNIIKSFGIKGYTTYSHSNKDLLLLRDKMLSLL